jgi:hypothetical protein
MRQDHIKVRRGPKAYVKKNIHDFDDIFIIRKF